MPRLNAPNHERIERVLRRTGAVPATDDGHGFIIEPLEAEATDVRWFAARAADAWQIQLFQLERCAAALRAAGIRATLATDGPEPRVRCLPPRRPGRPARAARAGRGTARQVGVSES